MDALIYMDHHELPQQVCVLNMSRFCAFVLKPATESLVHRSCRPWLDSWSLRICRLHSTGLDAFLWDLRFGCLILSLILCGHSPHPW